MATNSSLEDTREKKRKKYNVATSNKYDPLTDMETDIQTDSNKTKPPPPIILPTKKNPKDIIKQLKAVSLNNYQIKFTANNTN